MINCESNLPDLTYESLGINACCSVSLVPRHGRGLGTRLVVVYAYSFCLNSMALWSVHNMSFLFL